MYMAWIAKRLGVLTAVVIAAGALQMVNPTASFAANSGTCSGGSIAAGSYKSLTITGPCALDAGNVTVAQNVTVAPHGELIAAFGGSDIHIGGNLTVQSNGVLILGCEPEAFVCVNDPDQETGTLMTHDSVGLNLITQNALAVIVHASTFGLNTVVQGGGGGVTCDSTIPNVPGPPAYIDFEDNTIGGNSIVQGVHSCWAGYIRNHVARNVIYQGNMFADPDASELTTNHVGGNMICLGNSPQVQFGDSSGSPNIVGGQAIGECKNVV
jgi:hypothetical protein